MTETTSRDQREPSWADLAIRRMFGRAYSGAWLSTWEFSQDKKQAEKQRRVLRRVEQLCDAIWTGPQDKICETVEKIVLVGNCGTGKDRLLASLFRAAMAHLRSPDRVCRISGPMLWSRIRDGITDRELESQILSDLTSYEVLGISDPIMPGQVATDFQADWLYRILEARSLLGRATWITTNTASEEATREAYGVANASRLLQDAIVIMCDWDEYRAPKEVVK